MELVKKYGLWALAALLAIGAIAAYFVAVRAVADERGKKFDAIKERKDKLESRAKDPTHIPNPTWIKAAEETSRQRSAQTDECEKYLARQPRRAHTRNFFKEGPLGPEIEISIDRQVEWLKVYEEHNRDLEQQLADAHFSVFAVKKQSWGAALPTHEDMSNAAQLYWYQKDLADFLTQQDEKDLAAYMEFKARDRSESALTKPSDLVRDPHEGKLLDETLRAKPREKLVAILSAIIMNSQEQDLATIFNTLLPDEQKPDGNVTLGFPWDRPTSQAESASVLGVTMDQAQRKFLDEMVPADKPDLSNRQRFVDFVMELRTVRYRADVSGLLEAHGFEKLAASVRKGTDEELTQVLQAIANPIGEWNPTRIAQAIAAVVSLRDDKDFRLVRNNHSPDIAELGEFSMTYNEPGRVGGTPPPGARPGVSAASGPYLTHYFKMKVKLEFERIPVFHRRLISNSWRYRVQFTSVVPVASAFAKHDAFVADDAYVAGGAFAASAELRREADEHAAARRISNADAGHSGGAGDGRGAQLRLARGVRRGLSVRAACGKVENQNRESCAAGRAAGPVSFRPAPRLRAQQDGAGRARRHGCGAGETQMMMKPKILLAKYLAWAVLAVLALVLIFAIVKCFVLTDTTLAQLKQDIEKADRTVRDRMKDTAVPKEKFPDLLGELRNRFEHPAVLNPLLRDPFVEITIVQYPGGVIQLHTDQVYSIKVRGTRLQEVLPPEQTFVEVKLAYDLETGTSTVTFTALREGNVDLRVRADDERVHVFPIIVRVVPTPIQPNSPFNVTVTAHAPVEVQRQRTPAMVLIVVVPDNRGAPSRTVGLTTNVDIYRKTAGASDADYVRLNKNPLLPLNAIKIHEIWTTFQGPEQTAPVGPGPRPGPGPVVPEPAPVIVVPAQGAEGGLDEPAAGSFVYLDQDVDEGESYIYKAVTLSAAPGVPSSACKEPYVSPAPVPVVPMVEFSVARVLPDGAVLTLTRRDPDTGELLHKDVTVRIGTKIGGPLDIGTGGRHNVVDFSTKCILVGTLPAFRIIDYNKPRVTHVLEEFKWAYSVRFLTRDPRILYLTQRGQLHLKSKTATW